MTQDEIIRIAREAGFQVSDTFGVQAGAYPIGEKIERFADLVAAHVKSDQIQTAYQQGCEDMKRRMEKRMQQLEGQLQLCKTAVLAEREACAKVCDELRDEDGYEAWNTECAAAIRARSTA